MAADEDFDALFTSYTDVTLTLSGHREWVVRPAKLQT
jgi:hypothetical protein